MSRQQHHPRHDRLKKTSGSKPSEKRVTEPEASSYSQTNPEFALKPPPLPEDYADYVEHPRFGKAPRYTGLDLNLDSPAVHLHWRTGYQTEGQLRSRDRMLVEMGDPSHRILLSSIPERIPVLIPGTAVEADLSRQTYSPSPVTHYYDIDRTCYDCKRKFLFFAEEQKHWYEDLGFPLDSNAVRCTDCRKLHQNIALTRKRFVEIRKRFEQMLSLSSRSIEETLEMLDDCLTLIEAEEFSIRQCERVRMLLKRIPEERQSQEIFIGLTARLHAVESRARSEQDTAPADGLLILPGNTVSDEEPTA
jgi:hypothetical protein